MSRFEERSWQEFADAGLFWWINRGLHLFGWAIAREVIDGQIIRVYPTRVGFRGFDEDCESQGFKKLTAHLKSNIDELEIEANE